MLIRYTRRVFNLSSKCYMPRVERNFFSWNQLHSSNLKQTHNAKVFESFSNLQISKCYSTSSEGTSFNVQDEEDFNSQVLKKETPVIVDFHAEWCGPCKLLGPRLEKAVDSLKGSVLLAKVDVDDLGDIAMAHKVNAVPTVMSFKKGKMVDSFQGNIDDDMLTSFVEKAAKP